MKKRILVALFTALMIAPAFAATTPHATQAEARAMLKTALDFYKKNGRQKALEAFNKGQKPFSDRDLYVFCIGADRKLVADGRYKQYIGQDANLLKDSKGKSLGDAFLAAVKKTGEGELHYNWFNPVSQLIEAKVSFVARAGTDVCGVGTYDVK